MKLFKYFFSLTIAASIIGLAGCDKRENNVLYDPGVKDNILTVAQNNGLNIFAAAVRSAGIDTIFNYLGSYTIFAPTDAAFQSAGITTANLNSISKDLLRQVLRNHIIPGRITTTSFLPGPNAVYTNTNRDTLFSTFYLANNNRDTSFFFNGASLGARNIIANNGVIHVVNSVLAPPVGNLITTLSANPDYSLLVAAINRAGLATTLNSIGNRFTIFAPTNTAFQAAGYADVSAINAAPVATLQNILTYHVIPSSSLAATRGIAFAADFRNYTTLNTLQGTSVSVATNGNSVTVKGTSNATPSTVTRANQMYRSGIVHQINQVLLP